MGRKKVTQEKEITDVNFVSSSTPIISKNDETYNGYDNVHQKKILLPNYDYKEFLI